MKQASFSDLGQPTYNVVIYDNRLSSHPRGPSLIRMLLCFGKSRAWASLPFHCAKTVSELDPFHPTNLLFERKQIAQIIVTIRNSRNSIDRLEPISLPCAQRLATFRRKIRFPCKIDHPYAVSRTTKMPGGRPAGHSSNWFWGGSRFQFLRSANTVPRWCRLSAITPNPTHRFIPLSPL